MNWPKQKACWSWPGGRLPPGYGLVEVGRDAEGAVRRVLGHRVVAQMFARSMPAGRVWRWMCETPTCENPNHVRLDWLIGP